MQAFIGANAVKISIGSYTTGSQLNVDLTRLIETRLLIQANSGGGKSWCIRKILESTHGKVQHIVLDMEGEFASLREKYDYILAGKGGDIPADPRSAELLARKILELGTSLIIDLYELKHYDRIKFVKLFFDALVNAPKNLWHDCLIVLDEAHVFAPEKQQSEAMGSVIDLATRGRKRGFCLIPATQRLSKLHKDVAAECNNKLIGRTGLDIDMKRAAEELGFTSKSQLHELRELDPGEFFVFGPAFCKGVMRGTIGEVATKHPKSGQRGKTSTPAPTARVKQILAKLTDLPKEAAEEVQDRAQLKEKIRDLERRLKTLPAPGVDQRILDRAVEHTRKEMLTFVAGRLENMTATIKKDLKILTPGITNRTPWTPPEQNIAPTVVVRRPPERSVTAHDGNTFSFGKCERSILQFLAMREGKSFNNSQLGAMTGYSPTSGGFNNAISKLFQAGLISRSGGLAGIAHGALESVIEVLGSEYKSGYPHALEDWLNKLSKCEKTIYEKLLAEPDMLWGKSLLGEVTGYSPTSGGFNNALSRLCTLGLAKRNGSGISLNPEIVGI